MRELPFIGRIDILNLLLRAVVVLLCISVHEASHGLASYLLGDRTAKAMGRISLNPLRHIDPVGALCLLLFGFGWARPVMVNPYRFKNTKWGMCLVGLAGPLSNLLLALLSAILIKIFILTGILNQFLLETFMLLISMNIGLFVFNLIPIPPLDGSKIFLSFVPDRLYYDIMRYERIGWFLLVIALALGVLDPILSTANFYIIKFLFFITGVPFV